MMRVLVWALGLVLVLYCLGLLFLYTQQRRMIYFPPQTYLSPSAVGVPMMEDIKLQDATSPDGTPTDLLAWWSPPATSDAPTVMFFHGNASAVFSNHDIYTDMIAQGYGVLAVGYPGYPGSGGQLSQRAMTASARAHYQWLIAQGIAPETISFYGTSLGAAIATQLAASHEPALLILDAPFNSMVDMVRKTVPVYGFDFLVKDPYRSDQVMATLDAPVIILHGTLDAVIPPSQSLKLHSHYTGSGPATRHVVEGGHHTDLWRLGGRDIVMTALAEI